MDTSTSVSVLLERVQLQELISEVSSILEDLPPEKVDGQIQNGLQRIVEFLGIDRSAFGEFFEGEFRITHTYAVPGIEPSPKVFLRTILPWVAEKVSRGELIVLENPGQLPEEAIHEKAYAQETGIKSNLMIPFSIAGSMLCVIAFGSFRSYRAWPQPIIQQLKRVGEIFAHAVYRKQAQLKIHNQLAFEKNISDLSAQFVNIAGVDLDEQIEKSLEQLLSFFEMDRLALLKVSKDRHVATVTHSANAPGIPSAPVEINYVEYFPWHAKKILDREIVCLPVNDFPADAELDRKSAESMQIKTNLVIPIAVQGSVDYVLAANAIREKRIWDMEIASRIRLLGEIFVNALVRKNAEDQLKKSYDEIKILKNRLEAEAAYLRSEIQVAYHYEDIVGESRAIREIFSHVEQVAPTHSSVLILGETGTGKELIARAIHNLSPRKNRAMVKINCASLPPTLIENELFGREKGAYTGALTRQIGRFEIADGSTIFLDEVGELSMELQTKLLRVLQEGEFERLGSTKTIKVDVRVLAATNKNLLEEVRKRTFREDLYYRLNVFPITMPPLRERPEDIPLLVMAFLNELRTKIGKNIDSVPKQTMEALIHYSWPGNVRELRNVIEHAMILSKDHVLRVNLLQDSSVPSVKGLTLEEMERNHITATLDSTDWVIKGPKGAAQLLGLKPSTLYNKMSRLGIVRPREMRRAHN